MCGFTFTVFLSAFQLLPTAPFHILDLGGTTFAVRAVSRVPDLLLRVLGAAHRRHRRPHRAAPRADHRQPRDRGLLDRVRGHHRLPVMLALVLVHGVFWSGLLSASAAYMTNMLPERRRAEGIAYWGLSTIAAIAVAPTIGFWVFHFGWRVLCLDAAVAQPRRWRSSRWRLPTQTSRRSTRKGARSPRPARVARARPLVHAVPLFVRLRRHHQLHGAVRRRERRRRRRASI